MLIGLGLVPLLWFLYRAQVRRGGRMMDGYAQFGIDVEGARSARTSRGPAWWLLLLGVAILSVGMARPQAMVSVPRLESTVILAFDVSGSMAADDLKPTRMEAAKAAARQFVEAQPAGVRIGIVAFSDSGFAVQTPGYDREEILSAIGRLSPQRGTSLANGIYISLDTLAQEREPERQYYTALTPAPTQLPTPMPPGVYSSSSIVLFTDGENTERPDPLEAAQAAADRGVRVYTVGLGSPEGATIKVEGITVRTRLDAAALKQLAEQTGGQYFDAPSEAELESILKELEPELVVREEPTELTAMCAGASVLFLLAGAVVSMLRSGRIA
jgi:Ca-activated chloride channel family protein